MQLLKKQRKISFQQFGDFLVWYFQNAFSHPKSLVGHEYAMVYCYKGL